jgi:hypothetical protein
MVTNVKLADVEVGTPRAPTKWSNEERQDIPLDPREVFLDRMDDRTITDWRTQRTTQSLFLRHTEIPEDATIFHRNYLEYLEKCWADHLGIVITPDILWFTVLNELVAVVKGSPEPYRHLFTDSHEKKEIWVESADPVVMPLNRLVHALREQVPTDMGKFVPEFSTTSQRSRHAMWASFCDLCSPYYDYGMFLCAFPAISVQGTQDDWKLLGSQWRELAPMFSAVGRWLDTVQLVLDRCAERISDSAWWGDMFKLERCGSGHQTEVSGWFATLFREQPQGPSYVKNFPTNVAAVDYKAVIPDVTTGAGILIPGSKKDYRMQDGLFFSHQEGDFMVPDFGYTVHERTEPVVSEKDTDDMEIEIRTFNVEGARTLPADVKVEMGEDINVFVSEELGIGVYNPEGLKRLTIDRGDDDADE